ncbi:MAG: DUF4062 domain-containing protein [Planctomycetes bacterium]|nr:DUF4062 domain-containing protein [Planctomycetota bacterium]
MNQKRVFVSSVMRDFTAERAAARKAIETLRHFPVMAEDFGASPTSPQCACLEGVRQSEVYVGIFGERYGNRAESGLSPTEEEFREAERRALSMLCFVSKRKLDVDQKAFVDSIKDYEHGKLLAFYDTTEDLKDQITRGLNDMAVHASGGVLDATGARKQFDAKLPRPARHGQGEPELHLAIIPEQQVDEYFSPHDLGDEALRDRLEQLLFYGPQPRLFNRELGLQRRDGENFLQLVQGRDNRSPDLSMSLYSDASIIFSCSLRERERHGTYSAIRGFVVDEQIVRSRLAGFFGFGEQVYAGTASCRYVNGLFTWMQLDQMKSKTLGRIPEPEPNSFQMPSHSLDDPICIPAEPQRIARKELLEPEVLANDFLSRTVRKFQAAGGYYVPR